MPKSHRNALIRLPGIVLETVAAYDMLHPGDAVLVGLSGGPDSVALVRVLADIAPRFSLRLGIAHLNHGLRGEEADRDAAFAEALAARMKLPFHTALRDVRAYREAHRLSLEEAARRVRYDFFEEVARQGRYNKIALGHHADDNAELVLMYLLRGSGPLGLSGMAPIRDGRFIRPMLRAPRSDILSYICAEGLAYVTDSSNADTRYMRNRIRHSLIPALKDAYNPEITRALNRFAEIMRGEEAWIGEIVAPLVDRCLEEVRPGRICLSVPELVRMPDGPRRRVLREAVRRVKGDLRRITFDHIDALSRLAQARRGHKRLDLPDRVRVAKSGEHLVLSKASGPLRPLVRGAPPDVSGFEYRVSGPGILRISETGVGLKFSETDIKSINALGHAGQTIAFFDMSKVGFPIVVRSFRPGDRFTPLGISGTQKVKKYFINHKIPRDERSRCPVLLFRNKIIWIAGHRMDDTVKVTSSTRKILKAELLLA